MREYLRDLTQKFLHTQSLYRQMEAILEWDSSSRRDMLDLGSHFFQCAYYSLSRTFLVELYLLFSETEDRSLPDWLRKAKEHASSLDPTIYNPEYSDGDREPVSPPRANV